MHTVSSSSPSSSSPMPEDKGSAADSSLAHRVARLEGLVLQLTLGDVPTLQENQNKVRGRMDGLEQRLEQALEKLGLGNAVDEAHAKPMLCDLLQVRVLVDDRLQAARQMWKTEYDLEINTRADSVQELGRSLVRELERSTVDIVAKAVAEARKQAEQPAMAGDKLEKLSEELNKVRSAVSDIASFSTRTSVANNEKERAHLLEMSNTVERLLSATREQPQATLQADVAELRNEMRRLVSVDLHAILTNLQQLQWQSESVQTKVAEALAQNKTALSHEAKVRLQEDTRLEHLVKERLREVVTSVQEALAGAMDPAQADAFRRLISDESDVDSERSERTTVNEGALLGALGGSKPNSRVGSDALPVETCSTGMLSTETHLSPHLSRKGSTQTDGPVDMVDGLRDVILTYFRSEFQEHVVETLKKLQPHSQAGTHGNALPVVPKIALPNNARPSSVTASMQGSPQTSPRDLSSDISSIVQRLKGDAVVALQGNFHRPHAPAQAVFISGLSSGGSSKIRENSLTPRTSMNTPVGHTVSARPSSPNFQATPATVNLPVAAPAQKVGTGSSPLRRSFAAAALESNAPADAALAAFESKRAMWEAKSSPRGERNKRGGSPVRAISVNTTLPVTASGGIAMHTASQGAMTPRQVASPVLTLQSAPLHSRSTLPANFSPRSGWYPSSLPGTAHVQVGP